MCEHRNFEATVAVTVEGERTMIQPIVYRGNGETLYMHAYYPPNLMVTELSVALSGDPGAILKAIDDNGQSVPDLVLLPKRMPDGEWRFSEEMLTKWATEYCRVRDSSVT